MNKKLMVFGLVGLFAMALVGAVLTGYISNSVSADVTVSHPIEQLIGISLTTLGTDSIILSSVYGGEPSEPFYIRDTNLADVIISGVPENRVTGTGITCGDFKSVMVTTETKINGISQSISGPWNLIDLGLCEQDGDDVVFSYGPDTLNYEVGQEDTSTIIVTFKTDAVGTYTFTSNILPA